jgi:hypothetical protein
MKTSPAAIWRPKEANPKHVARNAGLANAELIGTYQKGDR